jgi:hypothetical protein
LSHRYCYLPLSWKSWNRFEYAVGGVRAETRFRLSVKLTSPFKSAGASVQSTTGSRGVRIRGSKAGYTMFRGSVKSTGYPLHSPVSPSLPLPCVTVCHHVSTGLYKTLRHFVGCLMMERLKITLIRRIHAKGALVQVGPVILRPRR